MLYAKAVSTDLTRDRKQPHRVSFAADSIYIIYIYIYIYNIQIYTNAEIKLSRKNHTPDEVNDNFYYMALDCSRYNVRSDRLRARYTAIMPTGHLRFMQITRTRNLAKNVN